MAGVGIVDMDRHEAAFVMVGVEQRRLLMAVHGIGRVIDIEGNGPPPSLYCSESLMLTDTAALVSHVHRPW
jgi:hypothetical protein